MLKSVCKSAFRNLSNIFDRDVLRKLFNLSWRRSLPYRNQSIDLLCQSMDWFLYDMDLHHEGFKVKNKSSKTRITSMDNFLWLVQNGNKWTTFKLWIINIKTIDLKSTQPFTCINVCSFSIGMVLPSKQLPVQSQ